MNLYTLLREREESHASIRVGIIGAGKFATMFMAQIIRTPGMRLTYVCDLNADRARANLMTAGFDPEQVSNSNTSTDTGVTVTEEIHRMLQSGYVDVVIESTGDPIAGAMHAVQCIEHGVHVVMVNVEADVLVGPMLNKLAKQHGVVYSLAYGDQPALIAEMVDMIRASGFNVVCAGKGTKYLPQYHASTPDTVWDYYGLTADQAKQGGMNSKMFNSFLDGTKSGIEMAAVANATGLRAPESGLLFPPCSVDDIAAVLKPESEGGVLKGKSMVEVISSLNRDGSELPRDLRWGVYVVFEAPTKYVERCFHEYGLVTDSSGKYSSMYRPYHLIGLELGISVASVALRGESTGAPQSFNADVVCVAKKDLKPGEVLDGEGGSTVWGRLTTAEYSKHCGGLPIGFASGAKVVKAIAQGAVVGKDDVTIVASDKIVDLRNAMEQDGLTA